MPNNKDYLIIQGWMINELNLSGNDLMTYALIFGFSKDGQSEYTGSLNYLCDWLKCTRKTAIKSLQYLVDNKLIKKTSVTVNNVTFNRYAIITQVVEKLHWGSVNSTQGGSVKITPNNTNINNTIYNIEERKLKFTSTLNPYLEVYHKETIDKFVAYWTEPNKSNTKFRYELEKTWDLQRRLNTWVERENKYTFAKPNTPINQNTYKEL